MMKVRGLAPENLGPTLRSARLMLRPPCEADVEPYAAFCADLEATRHIGGPRPRALAWRVLAAVVGSWAMRGYGMFSVLDDQDRWVGMTGPWRPADWPGAELGWNFARDSWGRGYASEAARTALDWAFENLDWDSVIHSIAPDNAASIRVAEKLGSHRIGPIHCPPPFDQGETVAWGQSRAEWSAGRALRGGASA